jgi:hypothetical protein
MSKKMFTYLAIKKLEPAAKRLELPDAGAPCFYVCVEPTGAKGFAMRFRRPDGRNARLVLGSFDATARRPHPKQEIGAPLTITEARLLAGGRTRPRVHTLAPVAGVTGLAATPATPAKVLRAPARERGFHLVRW